VRAAACRSLSTASARVASFGLRSAATRAAPGTRSCNSASRLATTSEVKKFPPVALPPGRPMLATSPTFTGSSPTPKTIGMVAVAALDARAPRRRLAPATGDSVLGLDLDWPARVAEVAPHFVAYSSTKFVRQGCQRLPGRSAAAFKRAVIRVE